MPPQIIRIATRQSPLALWQANHVRDLLLQQYPHLIIELVPMVTSGDKFLKDKLLTQGGKGLFVKELEEALLNNRADFAVHSTKDMPSVLPEGLVLAAFCTRQNPFDALISTHYTCLDTLPHQALIGTASLRRQSQLLAYRPDLQIKTLRGNINTRLAKLAAGEYDAIILAAAGLERLGMHHTITEIVPDKIMLPTCGQGALCIECRADDKDILALISHLNDPLSALCIKTERRVNAQLGGNCHVPLGVYCSLNSNNQLVLKAKILSLDGRFFIEDTQIGTMDQWHLMADQCTKSLIAKGASDLLDSLPL